MNTQVGRWGNSLAIRIPRAYAAQLGLSEGAVVEMMPVEGGLMLRRSKREFTLQELLDDITSENLHGETDWGQPVGRESA